VNFTKNLFDVQNPTFRNTLQQRETDKTHRFICIVDESVTNACPSLINDIEHYVNEHNSVITLAHPPIVVTGGEAVKNDADFREELHQLVVDTRLDRHAMVVVIGGGALLDTVGFVAATAHRGIRLVRVPTTVLAQNNSAIGIKTGVKVALIRDRFFFDWMEKHHAKLTQFVPDAMQYMIRRCAELHMHELVYGGDPFEIRNTRSLGFGHWAAHRLEILSDYDLRHGEAVAIGLALDARYSVLANYLPPGADERICALLECLGFDLWHDSLLQRDNNGGWSLLQGDESRILNAIDWLSYRLLDQAA